MSYLTLKENDDDDKDGESWSLPCVSCLTLEENDDGDDDGDRER